MSESSPRRPLSMSDIALKLGVAQSTVSRALREDPQVSQKVRREIQEAAKAMGYRPNPFVSALTSQVRSYRRAPAGATIAFLHCFSRSEQEFAAPYLVGARQRIDELGFQIDEMYLEDFEGSMSALSRALWTRSIPGLLVLPVPPGMELTGLKFENLAAAALDPSLKSPVLHRATPDYFQGMRLALEVLTARGYHRIGFCSYDSEVDHIGARWMACYQLWKYRLGIKALPPYSVREWKREPFEKWFRKAKPDAIISNTYTTFLRWLEEMGVSVPEETGFATLGACAEHPMVSGISQRAEVVGAAAVDLVVGQIYRNEYGLPKIAKRVSVEGCWVEGATVRSALSCQAH